MDKKIEEVVFLLEEISGKLTSIENRLKKIEDKHFEEITTSKNEAATGYLRGAEYYANLSDKLNNR